MLLVIVSIAGCVAREAGIKNIGLDSFEITKFADGNHINTSFVNNLRNEAEQYCNESGLFLKPGPVDGHLNMNNNDNAYGVMKFKCLEENDPELIDSRDKEYPVKIKY
ncbi:MAG: hypothetical protein D6B25_01035 [Desulfobulbaceae bacterium]|nr:MAG: hypothetical protein D6B25_01035 [Desulfobulbaceae bacterium]